MTVKRNFYVDDCLKSVKSAKNAVEFMHQLRSSKGGFRLTKWLSNSSEVLDCISRVERAPSVLGLDLDKDLDVRWGSSGIWKRTSLLSRLPSETDQIPVGEHSG